METLKQICSTGDSVELEKLLSEPKYIAVAQGHETLPYDNHRQSIPHLAILLFRAAHSGHLACVQFLLDFGPKNGVPYEVFLSRWEIIPAVETGASDVLKAYIEAWPKVVNLEMEGAGYPLMQTLINDKFDLSEYLLSHGADANAICGDDEASGTYLRYAAAWLAPQ